MGGFRVVCKSREEIEKEKEKEKMEGGGKEKKQKKGKGKEKVKSVESPRVAFDLDPDTDANQMDIDPLISNPDLEPAPNDEEDGEDGEPPLTSVNDQPTRDVDSRPGNRLSGGRIKTLPKDQRYRMTDIRRGRKEQAKIFSANDASPAGEDPDAMDVDLEGGENQTGAGGKSKENAGTGGKGKDGGKTVFLKGHEAGDFAALRVREQAGDAVVMKASDERILMALTGSFQRVGLLLRLSSSSRLVDEIFRRCQILTSRILPCFAASRTDTKYLCGTGSDLSCSWRRTEYDPNRSLFQGGSGDGFLHVEGFC